MKRRTFCRFEIVENSEKLRISPKMRVSIVKKNPDLLPRIIYLLKQITFLMQNEATDTEKKKPVWTKDKIHDQLTFR